MWRKAQKFISRTIMGFAFLLAGGAAIVWLAFIFPEVGPDATRHSLRLFGLILFSGLLVGGVVLVPLAWVAERIDPELRDEDRGKPQTCRYREPIARPRVRSSA